MGFFLVPTNINFNWNGKDVHCAFSGSDILEVTVDDVWEDDFSKSALVAFLIEKDVIKDTSWKIQRVQDTDGLTYTDDVYTTVTLSRM